MKLASKTTGIIDRTYQKNLKRQNEGKNFRRWIAVTSLIAGTLVTLFISGWGVALFIPFVLTISWTLRD